MRMTIALLFGLLTGVLMTLFTMLPGVIRLGFSLAALMTAIYFFQKYESKGMRIVYIASALVFSLFLPVVYVVVAYVNGWYLDPRILEGIEPRSS